MYKWERREKKLNKRKYGMKVSGKSVFLLQKIILEKANKKMTCTHEIKNQTKTVSNQR